MGDQADFAVGVDDLMIACLRLVDKFVCALLQYALRAQSVDYTQHGASPLS